MKIIWIVIALTAVLAWKLGGDIEDVAVAFLTVVAVGGVGLFYLCRKDMLHKAKYKGLDDEIFDVPHKSHHIRFFKH